MAHALQAGEPVLGDLHRYPVRVGRHHLGRNAEPPPELPRHRDVGMGNVQVVVGGHDPVDAEF